MNPKELNEIKDRAAAYAKTLGNSTGEMIKDLSNIGLIAVVDVPRLIAEIKTHNVELSRCAAFAQSA